MHHSSAFYQPTDQAKIKHLVIFQSSYNYIIKILEYVNIFLLRILIPIMKPPISSVTPHINFHQVSPPQKYLCKSPYLKDNNSYKIKR